MRRADAQLKDLLFAFLRGGPTFGPNFYRIVISSGAGSNVSRRWNARLVSR